MDRLSVDGARGAKLAVRIDKANGPQQAVALFAHCFTCSKDIFAARATAQGLAGRGITTVRFDFTGLGSSEGEFASTDFSSNVGDLVRVAEAIGETLEPPTILIGHSLGGAAALVAASQIPSVRAVVTIGAPADAVHVTENFAADVSRIESEGAAEVTLAGRKFTIRREFLEDLKGHSVEEATAKLRAALLVMHAPMDQQVAISNATRIFVAAKHPKSFVSLDDADHLLTSHDHARYAAAVIAAWASRYVNAEQAEEGTALSAEHGAVKAVSAGGKFRTDLALGPHRMRADEPTEVGGNDTGPTPYDLVSAGLAACTLMTMRMYAERKGLTVDASVSVNHAKVHADDCADCADATPGKDGRIDRFERTITFGEDTPHDARAKLIEISERCPVHRTLERGAAVVTREG